MSKNKKIIMWVGIGIVVIGICIGGWFFYKNYIAKESSPMTDLREPGKPIEKEPVEEKTTTPETCFTIVSGVITKYDYECGTEVAIPDTIKDEEVVEIGERVFDEMGLTKVIFNTKHLKTIGYYSFNNNHLTEVTIPETVTKIDEAAFNRNDLTKITIPKSVTKLNGWAFSSNELVSVVFEDGINLSKIGYSCFQENKLRSITIPDSVVTVEYDAFMNNNLTEINFGKVETLENGVFSRNDLVSITLPTTLKYIGGGAFQYNELESLTIPSNVMTIKGEAFEDNSLREVIIEGKSSEDDFESIGSGIYGWYSLWGFADGYDKENNLRFEK